METPPLSFAYDDCTDKLLSQFERANDTIDALQMEGKTQAEAITSVTAIIAPTFCAFAKERGQSAQFMSNWHMSLKARCSERFQILCEKEPTADKKVINQDELLVNLNAIRKGVRLAMRRDYALAKRLLYYTPNEEEN